MSAFASKRLLGSGLPRVFCRPMAAPSSWHCQRAFSQTQTRSDQSLRPLASAPSTNNASTGKLPAKNNYMAVLYNTAKGTIKAAGRGLGPGAYDGKMLSDELGVSESSDHPEPYHFHIYSHKHNTHVTVTDPKRNALISLSCGNLGFRKSGRKHYDSAYQLGAYVVDKMHQMNLQDRIHNLEVVLRGFGPGREAVVKVLLGSEGRLFTGKITKVSDATRLKFGGTRSKKPRRLG